MKVVASTVVEKIVSGRKENVTVETGRCVCNSGYDFVNLTAEGKYECVTQCTQTVDCTDKENCESTIVLPFNETVNDMKICAASAAACKDLGVCECDFFNGMYND